MKLTDPINQSIGKIAQKILDSSEKESKENGENEVRSKKEHEFIQMHVDNLEVIDLSPEVLSKKKEIKKEDLKENILKENVDPSKWIESLKGVIKSSSSGNKETFSDEFKNWINEIYGTPSWNSYKNNPIISKLIDVVSDALNIDPSSNVVTKKVNENFEPIERITDLENDWKAALNSPEKIKEVIKKYKLQNVFSSIRQGELKLGLKNMLNGKKVFAGLDNDNKLVFVSGSSKNPKVVYFKV